MKITIPIIVAIVICWMLSAMAETQAYGNRLTADIQFTQSGIDMDYIHGAHCIDGRAF